MKKQYFEYLKPFATEKLQTILIIRLRFASFWMELGSMLLLLLSAVCPQTISIINSFLFMLVSLAMPGCCYFFERFNCISTVRRAYSTISQLSFVESENSRWKVELAIESILGIFVDLASLFFVEYLSLMTVRSGMKGPKHGAYIHICLLCICICICMFDFGMFEKCERQRLLDAS